MNYHTYLPKNHDMKPNMRRGRLFYLLLLLLFPFTACASVTAEIKAGTNDETAILLLKSNGKVVKKMDIDLNAGNIPEVTTFSSKYCGNPAQVVILTDDFTTGVSTGSDYRYLIFNPSNWTIMDDFNGADTKEFKRNWGTSAGPILGATIAHTDGAHTEKLLRAGRYYGPVCRIFDLYTKPLPPSGPSFDCKTASSLAEQTICKDPKLATLDRAYGARIQQSLRSSSPEERQNIANRYDFDMHLRDISGTDKREIAKFYKDLLGSSKKTAGGSSNRKTAEAACSKAATPTEGAICANPDLKKLDTEMAAAYHQAFAATQAGTPARKALIDSQRQWLKARDACQADASCLEGAYRERVQALRTP